MSINEAFQSIEKDLLAYLKDGKRLFATSSFQTHSLPMLHIISRIDKSIPIYFINTGFHFPETLSFRDIVADQFGLNLIDHHPQTPKVLQKDVSGQLYFTSDPDYCCFLNKTQPMEPLLGSLDIWINGIRRDQNANRKNMNVTAPTPQGCLRYHPMLDWTGKMIYQYINEFELPRHPLEAKGYVSIGCEPCTRKQTMDGERGGRWFGMKKTECGLHTDLVKG